MSGLNKNRKKDKVHFFITSKFLFFTPIYIDKISYKKVGDKNRIMQKSSEITCAPKFYFSQTGTSQKLKTDIKNLAELLHQFIAF